MSPARLESISVARKRQAFENLRAERIYTSIGMIIVRGINEHEVKRTRSWPA